MDRFTNGHVGKHYKKIKSVLIISFLVILIGIGMVFYGINQNNNYEIEEVYLDDIITSDMSDKEDMAAYLDIYYEPLLFAEDYDTSNKYYIVWDQQFAYIIYYDSNDISKLEKEDIYDNPVRVSGVTTLIPNDIRDWAIEAYNAIYEDEEDYVPVDENNYTDYLGSIYLDTTISPSLPGDVLFAISIVFFLFGGIFFIVALVGLINFKKNIKKLTDDEIYRIDMELNSSNSQYYKKSCLFLTQNYIVDMNNNFNVIRYEDLIWIFPYELRQNGVKSTQAVKVIDKNGKLHTIASTDALSKKGKSEFNEIFNAISSKNDKLVVGYNKETKQLIKEKYNYKA